MSQNFLPLIAALAVLSLRQGYCQTDAGNPGPGKNDAATQSQNQQLPGQTTIPAVVPPSAKEKPKKRKKHSEEYYQSRQTTAEVKMARYTKYSFWASFAQIIVAIGGIIYVALSLCEMRRQTDKLSAQNKVLIKIHNAENRPWVSFDVNIKDGFERVMVDNEEGYILRAVCTSQNTGESPATHIGAELHIKAVPVVNADREAARLMHELAEKLKKEGRAVGGVVFPKGQEQFVRTPPITKASIIEAAGSVNGVCTIVLYGAIQYRFPGKSEIHQTKLHSLLGWMCQQQPVVAFVDIPASLDLSANPIGVRVSGWTEAD